MGRRGYTLTVRHGSRVSRERFDGLSDALGRAEQLAEDIRREGPLAGVKMLREFESADRVAARIELSTGGWLRGRSAGVDVMGDGSLVAYRGGVRRESLAETGEAPFAALHRALS